jgi:predicted transposase YbfD/YdcC
VLDVTLKEDDCRIRTKDGAENISVIRRFCLNMAHLHSKKSQHAKQIEDGWLGL